jgi:hypothetical protein
MSLANIAEAAAGRLFGKLALYAAFAFLGGIFGLVALYHFTIAGMIALELQFGVLVARLIVAGVFLLLSLASGGMLWFLASRAGKLGPAREPTPRHIQLAALIEALILGYEMARKGRRSR